MFITIYSNTENKRTQLRLQIELAEEITVTSLTEVTAVGTTDIRHERKNRYSEYYNKFSMQSRNRPETF